MSALIKILIADLYIRVSTEEQADKGFSQRYQEEVLRKYCEANSIHVKSVIYEDFSAKTFNRPQWIILFNSYKKSKGNRPQRLLFTKWDRFSRNTAEAYATIRTLEGFGIQPIAIEQPLDITVPENQMTLAFYLTIPEVENARRGLNIKQGIRRAKKEGRCTGLAPVGYTNRTTENGSKYIAPTEPYASIMKVAFERIASKTHNISQAHMHAVENGFQKSKNCFWRAIRNSLYCGKIKIHATSHESEQYAQGTHEPIISETLFFKVQRIINKKQEKLPKRATLEHLFPLRGFLVCTNCGALLTGSGSQGKSKKYYYYHCRSTCKCRLRTEKLNHLFVEQLKSLKLCESYYPICLKILKRILAEESELKTKTTYHLKKKIDETNNKINKARELLLQGDIDGTGFRKIKTDSELQINILCEKLSTFRIKQRQFSKDVNTGLSLFSKLHQLYEEGEIHTKRELIRKIFPEYLVSDGIFIQTTMVTDAIKILYNKETIFTEKVSQNHHSTKKDQLSQTDIQVIREEDCNTLKRIALLQQYKITTNEAKEAVSFITMLSRIITEFLLK
jgi:DNA invertase Pin-like site-specific DNA recombinase